MRAPLRALLLLLVPASFALAEDSPTAKPPVAAASPNPLSDSTRMAYRYVKSTLLRSAELMPEESYGFRPTEKVRTFGQVIGHVADAQYRFCSVVLGEKNPSPQIEKTKTSKADLIVALKDAVAYCDKAYDGMTDASAPTMVNMWGSDGPRLFVLAANTLHSVQHYGSVITYLRMKDIVPPSSDPEVMKQVRK